MKKILIITAVIIFLTTSYKSHKTVKTPIRTVKTEDVRPSQESQKITYPGKVIAASEVDLAFRIAGPIAKIKVTPGKFVKKGDILAEMDDRDYKLQFSATEAEFHQIQKEANRVIELYKRGSTSENDRDKAFYGLKQIKAKYKAHKNALADTKLRAPYDGYIQKINYSANETVDAGFPIVTMISSRNPEVEIHIPASEYIRRDRFSNAECIIDVYEGVKFPLQLIGITRQANLNQLYTARFLLKSVDNITPTPGMSVNTTIHINEDNCTSTIIPNTAIFEKDNKTYVWIYNESAKQVSAREVKAENILKNGNTIITEGLKAGEIVVTAGVNSLNDGQEVKELPRENKTNIGNIL